MKSIIITLLILLSSIFMLQLKTKEKLREMNEEFILPTKKDIIKNSQRKYPNGNVFR